MKPEAIWLISFLAAFVAGHFIGYRSGWRSCTDSIQKRAEKAVSDSVAAAASAQRLPVGLPPATAPIADADQPPPPVTIGQRFTYMGLLMVCVSHSIRMPLGVLAPGMSAEYVDADGLVRSHYWTPEQYGAVRAELARRVDPTVRS